MKGVDAEAGSDREGVVCCIRIEQGGGPAAGAGLSQQMPPGAAKCRRPAGQFSGGNSTIRLGSQRAISDDSAHQVHRGGEIFGLEVGEEGANLAQTLFSIAGRRTQMIEDDAEFLCQELAVRSAEEREVELGRLASRAGAGNECLDIEKQVVEGARRDWRDICRLAGREGEWPRYSCHVLAMRRLHEERVLAE